MFKNYTFNNVVLSSLVGYTVGHGVNKVLLGNTIGQLDDGALKAAFILSCSAAAFFVGIQATIFASRLIDIVQEKM